MHTERGAFCPAALVGYVEYPVAPLISGLSPVQALHANSTLVDTCAVPGTGPGNALYSGRLVSHKYIKHVMISHILCCCAPAL